jgi:tetratricopeptide (TPR) repeat protein
MLLALITVLVVWQRSGRPYLLMGWLWFVGTLVPVIGLVQAGSQSIADRYLYIPAIGVYIMLAWGCSDLLKRWPRAKVVAWPAGAAALSACVVLTSMQLRYWKDSETLFRHALAVTGDNVFAEYALGDTLGRMGKLDESLYHLQRSLRISPNLGEGIVRIADLLARQGKIREAIDEYRLGLKHRTRNINANNNLAWLLATAEDPTLRQPDEAVELAKRACEEFEMPGNLDTLAAAYAGVGRYTDAVKTGQRARALALLSGDKKHAAQIRQRIELYRSGQAYYEVTPKKAPPKND